MHAYKDKMAMLFSPKNCYAKGKLAAESMKCSWHVKSLRRIACHVWTNGENKTVKISLQKFAPTKISRYMVLNSYLTDYTIEYGVHVHFKNNDVDIALERFSEHVFAA